MFQYTKKCSTRQKRRARRQNCKVERSATNSFTPEGDHQAGQEGRYENTNIYKLMPGKVPDPTKWLKARLLDDLAANVAQQIG